MRTMSVTTTLLVTGLAGPLLAATPADAAGGSAAGEVSSAYGIYAGGLLNFPARPSVTSVSGPGEMSAALPKNPVLNLALFTVTARRYHASARVLNLAVADPELKKAHQNTGLLGAKAISAQCDNGVGSAHLADITLAGHTVPIAGPPNTDFVVPAEGFGLRVTPNKQIHNADGTLTVIGLQLDVSIGRSVQTINIASTTCGRPGGGPAPTPTIPGVNAAEAAKPQQQPQLGEAPQPVPVPMDPAELTRLIGSTH
jgi:hypothetical protein